MDFLTYVKEHQNEVIEATKELLRIPSVLDRFDPNSETPFGKDIQAALEFMLKRAKKDGFITKNVRNYAAHIEHGEGEDILGVLCHLDVVPTGEEADWSTPPFHPTIKDGKLYARGAMDDKGPTMAAYFALKFLKDLGVQFNKRIRIILGTDEETGWRGIEEYFKTEEMPTIGFAPDASFPLIYGEKGIYSFDLNGEYTDSDLVEFYAGERYNVVPDQAHCILKGDYKEAFESYLSYHGFKGHVKNDVYTVYGKNAHAMTPNLGVNAAFILAQFLGEHIKNPYINFINEKLAFDPYAEKLGLNMKDEEMKEFTINAGIFKYNKNEAMIGVNCRYPKGYNFEEGEALIVKKSKKYKLEYTLKGNQPIHYVDPNDPLVKTLMDSYQKVTNDFETKPFTIGGGTYARALDKAVAFGLVMPGRKDVAHQVDEHVYLEDLIEATAIYMEAIYALTR